MATPGSGPGLPPTMQFASLYVGDLHPDVSEAALYQAFQVAGNVASCRVCRDSTTRKSLCYGYVNYYNVEDAEKALEELNYTQINGRSCRVMWSQRDAAARKGATGNIFVKNLDESIDNKALHDTFSIFGNILSCKVALDANGKSKGYGFVHYEAEEAAKQAIERVNGMQIGESTVFVGPFMKREELEGTGGPEAYTNLYVKNFPASWDDSKLNSVFKEHGEVISSVIMANTDGKRFALVNYKGSSMAKAAVAALHRKDMREESSVADDAPTAEVGEAEKADVAAVGASPAEAAPAEASPAEASPAEASPAEASPAEASPAEASPVEASPGDAPAAEPAAADDAAPAAAEVDAANAEVANEDDHPEYLLYVQRAQTRAERREMLIKERKQKGVAAKERPVGVRVCVRNLGEDVSSEQLREKFEPYGKVLSALVKTNEDGKCRGLGFVVYATQEEATKAIAEAHLTVFDDKPLNVTLAERRRPRGEQGGPDSGSPPGARGEEGSKPSKGGKGKGGRGKPGGKGGKSGKGVKPAPAAPPGALGARAPLPPYLYGGLQPPFPPGVLPHGLPGALPPGYRLPPGAGRAPAPAGPIGPRPATYSLPPATLVGRPPVGGTSPAIGPLGSVPPGAFPMPQALRPPFGYAQATAPAMGSPPLQPMMGLPQAPLPPMMPAMARAPGAPLGQFAGRPPLPNLTKEILAALPPQQQKQQLGERLFPLIARQRPELAGKITGMMLELVNDDILTLLDNERALKRKVDEAVAVLEKPKS